MDVHSATAQIAEFALRQKAALFASFREDAEPGASVLSALRLEPLEPFPLASPAFSHFLQEPG
jgi:hypothetical protein